MNPEQLYVILTQIAICVSAVLTLFLLFMHIPWSESMQGYRRTRFILVSAYGIVFLLNLAELFLSDGTFHQSFMLLTTLTVSSIQVFLFAATLMILLNEKLFPNPVLIWELAPSLQLAFVGYFLLLIGAEVALDYYFWLFGAYFVFQIVRYSFLYSREYKLAVHKMDNYYSEEESQRLKWTKVAYIGLTVISVMSALSLLCGMAFLLVFTVGYIFFYIYFGIHFINFSFFLLRFGKAFNPAEETNGQKEKAITGTFEYLEGAILKWERQKKYTEPHLTIEHVSTQLSTNRTYLSHYMNTYRNQSFKDWINHLRIEESTRLMSIHPDMPVSQIGTMVGLPDKSNFGRQFSKVKGKSPKAWRKDHLL